MCTLLYLAPFFLPLNLSSNDRKQKSVIDKEQTPKNMGGGNSVIFGCIWAKIEKD